MILRSRRIHSYKELLYAHHDTHARERESPLGREDGPQQERKSRASAGGRVPGHKQATRPPDPPARHASPPAARGLPAELQLPSDCPTQFCNGKIRGGHTCSAPADLHEATCHMISQGQARTRLCTHPVQLYTAYTLVRYTVNVTIAAIVCMHHAAPTVSRISRVHGSFERRCSRAAGRVRA